jgi:hypothetical protein
MGEYPLHTVTLPILVDAGREQPDGWCFFRAAASVRLQAVRNMAHDEAKRVAHSTKESRDLRHVLNKLRNAYSSRDGRRLLEIVEELRPWMWKPPKGVRVLEKLDDPLGVARQLFSELMSMELIEARLVVWWTVRGRMLSPAIYCPNQDTALFVRFAMQDYRLCPKCGTSFVPTSQRQVYCKPSHGIAHRTQRSRKRIR